VKRSLNGSIALACLVLSCGGKDGGKSSMGGPSPLSDQVLVQNKDLPEGLELRVSNGKQGPPAFEIGRAHV